jgi:hypothetical protein
MFFYDSCEHPVGVEGEESSAYGETSRFDNGGYFGGDGPLMILFRVYIDDGGEESSESIESTGLYQVYESQQSQRYGFGLTKNTRLHTQT